MPAKNELRVLFITRTYPPAVGGMEKWSYELACALGERVQVDTIAWSGGTRWFIFFLLYCVLSGIVKCLMNRPDVIHLGDATMCLAGVPLKLLFGIPVCVNVHGLDVTRRKAWCQKIIVPLMDHASQIVCISRPTRDRCLERGISAPITIIHPGMDFGNIAKATEQDRHVVAEALTHTDGRPDVILTVGRLVKRKGVENFIREILPLIVEERPSVKYWVVGDGPEREYIERAIRDTGLGERVRVWGYVSEGVLSAIYERADLFAMPNVSVPGDPEGFGLVALEASASETPVMARELDGIPDAVHDGKNGVLVPPDEPEQFAARIIELLNDDERRIRLGQRAASFVVSEYDWDVIAPRYIALFRSLVKHTVEQSDSREELSENSDAHGTNSPAPR